MTVTELAAGVHAFVQADGSWWVNNAGFVVGDDGVLVIDTASTEARTRALRAAIAAATDLPVRAVLNTHHHGDHTNGNCVFPEALVIGHVRCRDEVAHQGIGGYDAIWGPVDWGDLRPRPPELALTGDAELQVGARRVEIRALAPVAHTTNDLVAWLPDVGVLFAGDLVFNGGTPFVLMGSIAGSFDAIEAMRALAPAVIVPGHGPVCDVSVLDDIERYLRFVEGLAFAGHEAGRTPLEVARDADLGRFAAWHDTERLAGNLHRAYSELDGHPRDAPVDIIAAFTDMLALNGGAPLRCIA